MDANLLDAGNEKQTYGSEWEKKKREKEVFPKPVSQAHDESFIALIRWMKKEDCNASFEEQNSDCLGLCDFHATGRGLRALHNVQAGDKIVSLPFHLLITCQTVFHSQLGSVIKRCNQAFTPQALLTLFLAVERCRGKASFWSPYIQTLPAIYSTPLYFSSHELSLLPSRANACAMKTIESFSNAKKEIMNFYSKTSLFHQYTVSDECLRWAWFTVETRSVYLETKSHPLLILDPHQSNVALAPFLDMLNHSDTAQTTASLNQSTNRYEIVTHTPYRKHDQVFISYGAHDNTRLLVNYGFTLPKNINNCFMFSMDDVHSCFPSVENWKQKAEKLKESQLYKNLICDIDGVSWSLLSALKVFALTFDELHLWKKLIQGQVISKDNNKQAFEMAKQLVKTGLGKAQEHLRYIESQLQSTHRDLIKTLAIDDVEILQHSLEMLQKGEDKV